MRLSVILVHYHTPALVAAAVEALRSDLREGMDGCELLLVDNGSDEAGRAQLEALPVRRLAPGRNLGFAGGVNFGVAQAKGDRLVLMNPDVTVLRGCLPALLGCLDAGADVAGPRFYWDSGRRLVLPPTELRSRLAELWRALATRGPGWAAWARRHWRRHARRHWEATAPLSSFALSGALLALRRSAWERVGPFDEGYRLYFEESDWLERARMQGTVARYVPSAAALHHFGQSAAQQPQAAAWFEESAGRFRRRRYGAAWASLVEHLAGGSARGALPPVATMPSAGLILDEEPRRFPLWLEISPGAVGFPAAAERIPLRPPEPWSPAEPARRRVADGETWLVTVSDRRGCETGRWRLGAVG